MKIHNPFKAVTNLHLLQTRIAILIAQEKRELKIEREKKQATIGTANVRINFIEELEFLQRDIKQSRSE